MHYKLPIRVSLKKNQKDYYYGNINKLKRRFCLSKNIIVFVYKN